jgi:hypothetical protein
MFQDVIGTKMTQARFNVDIVNASLPQSHRKPTSSLLIISSTFR